MADPVDDILKVALGIPIGVFISLIVFKVTEASRAHKSECGRLRDLALELELNSAATSDSTSFDFHPLPRRRWDDAPQALLHGQAPGAYGSCAAAYAAVDRLNANSAEVQRRGQVRQHDEGDAKRDVRNTIAAVHGLLENARAEVATFITRHC